MHISVFDLDHTLIKANSSFKFGCFLYRQKLMSLPTLFICLSNYASHKWLGLSVQKIHKNIFRALFNGRNFSQIQEQVQAFLKLELQHLIYQPAFQRLHQAQQRGDHLVILSSSPDFLVGPISSHFKVDHWKATCYSKNNQGQLSSITHILEGHDKAEYLQSLALRLGVPLTATTVYSDSHLDLPMLQIAGKAVGVAPNKTLKKICRKNGWEII